MGKYVNFLARDLVMGMDDDGLLIVEVDMQGIWDQDPDLQLLKLTFPRVWKVYREACMTRYGTQPGKAMLIKDGGWNIMLFFTRRSRNEGKEIAVQNFVKCMKQLQTMVGPEVPIYSPLFGRASRNFNEYFKVICDVCKEEGYKWFICRKNTGGSNG